METGFLCRFDDVCFCLLGVARYRPLSGLRLFSLPPNQLTCRAFRFRRSAAEDIVQPGNEFSRTRRRAAPPKIASPKIKCGSELFRKDYQGKLTIRGKGNGCYDKAEAHYCPVSVKTAGVATPLAVALMVTVPGEGGSV
jgi:hypothetical protein